MLHHKKTPTWKEVETNVIFLLFLARIHKWQDQMFHEFMHSTALFAFDKSKNPEQKCAIDIWVFQPRSIGKVSGPGFPSVLLCQKHHLKQKQQIRFPGTAKDFLQPQTLTGLKGPWSWDYGMA